MPVVNDDGVFETELEAAIPTLPSELKVEWDKMNQPFGEVKSTSKEDTPVVATTASPLVTITEGDVGEAINVGMGAGPGTIAGVTARTAKLGRLGTGMDYTKPETTAKTGWWQGADGKFKFEISDEGMKLVDKDWKFGEKGKLGDFIEHPELFKAYPEFKDMAFEVGQKTDKYIASFNPNTKTLKINPSAIKSGDEGILDVIIHEVQHAVQNKEGFASGSNPTFAAEEALTKLAEKIYSMPHSKAKLEAQDLYFQLRNNKDDFGQYMYLRSPGEIEANIVSARRKLSDEMRKKFPIEDHKKLVEGEVNTTHGGKYLPEFWYPKPSKGPTESAMAKSEYPMDLENAASQWAQGKLTNKELREIIKEKGWSMNKHELQRSRKGTVEVFDPAGNPHELQP